MTTAEIQSRVDKLDGFYQALKAKEQGLITQVATLKDNVDLLIKTSSVLKHLLDVMVKDEINKISGLITYGLNTVFDDQNLSFHPVISKKNDRVYIELKTLNNGHEMEFGSFGGSVAVVESFLLRIICMLKMNLARFMLLDETFAPLGAEYLPNANKLVGELARKLGLDVLLVTQQQADFQGCADRVYKIKNSSDGVVSERIK